VARMQTTEDQAEMSNLSETIMEALAQYTQDKGHHDRTGMTIARNQVKFEKLGVSAEMIRLLFKESKLTVDERLQKYSDELRYRKAVSLWNAETEEDFDRAMQAASETMPAGGHASELLTAARSYNDGFNSSVHGKQTTDANPHVAGTLQHAQWAKGCKDGLKHLKELGEELPEPASDGAPAKRGRGRPRRVQEQTVMANGPDADESAGLLGGFPSEMPS
jgi:hypothetical protein